MKKQLAIVALALMAFSASAVNMVWGSATAIKFNGTNLKEDTTVIGYLIAVDSFATSYTLSDSFKTSDIGTQVDVYSAGTSKMSKIQGSWTIDTDHYDNGSKFAMLLVYTGASDGKTYYNLSSDLVEMSGMSLDPPVNAGNTSSSFSYSTSSESGKLKSGGGWTAVPEPSTAMLAIAGLALLLKRRKA